MSIHRLALLRQSDQKDTHKRSTSYFNERWQVASNGRSRSGSNKNRNGGRREKDIVVGVRLRVLNSCEKNGVGGGIRNAPIVGSCAVV